MFHSFRILKVLGIILTVVGWTYIIHLIINYYKDSKKRVKVQVQPSTQIQRIPYTIPDQFPMSTNTDKGTSIRSEIETIKTFEPEPSTSAQAQRELRLQKQKENFIIQIDGKALDLQKLTARLLAISKLKFVTEEDWLTITILVDREEICFESEAKSLLIDLFNSDLSILQPNDWDSIQALNDLEVNIYARKYDQSKRSSFNKKSGKTKKSAIKRKSTVIQQEIDQVEEIERIDSVVLQVELNEDQSNVQCLSNLQNILKLNTQRFNTDVTNTKFDILAGLTFAFLVIFVAIFFQKYGMDALSFSPIFFHGIIYPFLVCIHNEQIRKFVLNHFCPDVNDYNL